MTISFSVSDQSPERVKADMLAVAMFADRELGPGADAVDTALNGDLRDFLEETNFTGTASVSPAYRRSIRGQGGDPRGSRPS